MTDLVVRVRTEVNKGVSLEDVQKTVTVADWRKKLAGEDEQLGRAFDVYFVQPAVGRVYHQIKGDPDTGL